MNHSSSKDSHNVSYSPSHGINRISGSGASLMNGNGHLIYRRSPILQNQQISQQQLSSFDNLSSPSHNSYNSEEISETHTNSSEDDNLVDLRHQLEAVQKQVQVLIDNQASQDERYKRSRQENDFLSNKIHCLEDQIRELELSSEARAKEDEKRFRETMAKQIKLHSQDSEQHLKNEAALQQDIISLQKDLIKSETLIKALRSEKQALELELQEKNSELLTQDDEIHKLKLSIKHLKDEESVKSNLINIMQEELEDNHNRSQHHNQSVASSSHNNQSPKQRSSSSRRSSVTSGFGDDVLSSNHIHNKTLNHIDVLETSLNSFRDENKRLKEANEELQAQLLNLQLEEGRSLVQEGNKSYSLADEMGDIDVHRLLGALKEQQDDNARLRRYLDDMLLKIVEKYPDLLDKTSPSERADQLK